MVGAMADPMLVYWVAAIVIGALALWVITVLVRAPTRTAPGVDGAAGPATGKKKAANAAPAEPPAGETDEDDASKDAAQEGHDE